MARDHGPLCKIKIIHTCCGYHNFLGTLEMIIIKVIQISILELDLQNLRADFSILEWQGINYLG